MQIILVDSMRPAAGDVAGTSFSLPRAETARTVLAQAQVSALCFESVRLILISSIRRNLGAAVWCFHWKHSQRKKFSLQSFYSEKKESRMRNAYRIPGCCAWKYWLIDIASEVEMRLSRNQEIKICYCRSYESKVAWRYQLMKTLKENIITEKRTLDVKTACFLHLLSVFK